MEYLHRFRGALRFPDQDALNFALHGEWLELGRKWNHMRSWELEPGVGGRLEDARVIHTAGPFKLWQPEFADGVRKRLYESLRDKARPRRPVERR